MAHDKEYRRRSRPKVPNPNLIIIALSGFVTASLVVVLGIIYGLVSLDSWNVWPAFIIIGAVIGFVVGGIIGLFIYLYRFYLVYLENKGDDTKEAKMTNER
jgi:membrane protein YdbS with pleckstrin-like domain